MKNSTTNWQFGSFIIHEFIELPSTNSLAFELASNQKISNREIILAHLQTKGKGRLNRKWHSPAGNLYFSIVLTNQNLSQFCSTKISQISFIAVAALGLALKEFYDKVNFKWPNDLLINNRKVAGVLLESKLSQQKCDFVVIGIGVNTVIAPEQADLQSLFPATSLKNCQPKAIASSSDAVPTQLNNNDLLKRFLGEFEKLYENWLNFGFGKTRNLWLESAFRLDKNISLNLGNSRLEGIFETIDFDGNLLLKTANEVKKINCGDVGI